MKQTFSFFRRAPKALQLCALLVGLGVLVSTGQVGAQAPAAAPAAARQTLKVLFIGNSYTFYNNLGDIVAGISRSKKDGPVIESTIATSPNKDLAWHIANDAIPAIEKGGWDFVNIQETSLLPGGSQQDGKPVVGDPAKTPGGYWESVRDLVKRVRAVKATPILEMTWARRDNPGKMQEDVAKAVGSIAQELGVKVAPAGLAWTEGRWRLRTLEFHFRDGSHPSEIGSYLTACVMYATITGKNPRGAASTIMGHPVSNEGVPDMKRTVPLVEIGPATAAELQAIAWDTVNAYHNPSQVASR